jgi:hypothetical protein
MLETLHCSICSTSIYVVINSDSIIAEKYLDNLMNFVSVPVKIFEAYILQGGDDEYNKWPLTWLLYIL